VAEAKQVQPHPRANRDVEIRALDPNGDDKLWEAVLELQVAEREEGREEEESYRAFARARLHDRRTLFRTGRGAWYVALDLSTEDVTASCGIVVTAGRGRFQAVETAAAYQRRGICSRLLVEAARHATVEYEAQRFVIVADLHYHALGLYESRVERIVVTPFDALHTMPPRPHGRRRGSPTGALSTDDKAGRAGTSSPLTDSNRRPPSLPWRLRPAAMRCREGAW
jgi:ribosomal protein S18 acetylase RimI-like enzyme